MTREETKSFIASLIKLRESLTDAQASTAAEVYPSLKNDGTLVPVGTRINWNGTIKRAAIDLWDTEINNPNNTPTLWEDINYIDGYRVIPETITSGTAFNIDEYGYWKGVLYKSLIDNNVWTPEQYSAGWQVIK